MVEHYSDKYADVVLAVLQEIRLELDRCYWNKYQKEMWSPFDNTGESYSNNTFFVSAYDWGENLDKTPNFQYKDLKVYWYKYCGRGMSYIADSEIDMEYLANMLQECKEAIVKDFQIV